ncbi:MAG TPA: hypothetical protein VGN63_01700 [Flavisolibacter sp.]|jgi:hypothetical protein|nr:hypothetical protein [Flavisolibacter sp.]
MNVLVKNHSHSAFVLLLLCLQNTAQAYPIPRPLSFTPIINESNFNSIHEVLEDTTRPSTQTFTSSAGCGPVLKVEPPKNPIVKDVENSFDWTYISGYESPELYEYTLDGGTLYQQVTQKPQVIPDHNFEIGQVGVRLKEGVNHYASETIYNPIPFTAGAILENLLAFSENFDRTATDGIWQTLAGGYTKASSIINPFNQPVSYQYYVNGAATGSGRLVTKYSVLPDVVYTFSIYVKYENLNSLRIQMLGRQDNQWAIFNVEEGKVLSTGTGCTAGVVKAQNGWYRVSITFVPTTIISNGQISISTPEIAGEHSRRYLLFGAQLNRGNAPATYIKTP